MAASILDAIQNVATPNMIETATSALGISESAATSTLGAAAINLLGGLVKKSDDPGTMDTVATLVSNLNPDGTTFANMAGLLSGGPPVSPAQVAGNKLLSSVLGDKSATSIAALAFSTGVNPQAASGLTTLAAPLVLTALRSKLGANATGADLSALLKSDAGVITSNMPPAMRAMYGFADAPAATPAPAPAAPAVSAPVAAAVAAVAPVVATVAAAANIAPVPAAAPQVDPAPVTAPRIDPAPVVNPAPAASVPVVPAAAIRAAPIVQTSSGYASAPMAAAPAAAAPAMDRDAVPAVEDDDQSEGLGLLPLLGLLLPVAILSGLLWYWAYGMKPAPVAAPKPVAAVAKDPAPAPAPAAALVTMTAGQNGMVHYGLPGGASFDAAKDGVESQLVEFITNKDKAIDNKLWFNFDRLTFVTGSHELSPESKDQVSNIVTILKAFPAVSAKIGGYTDNQGEPESNLALSDKRANAVMAAIVAGGIGGDRLEAKGYGDQFPIGDNGTPEGRAKNRRTSVSVRGK